MDNERTDGSLDVDLDPAGVERVSFGLGVEGLARLRHHGPDEAAPVARAVYRAEDLGHALLFYTNHRRSPFTRAAWTMLIAASAALGFLGGSIVMLLLVFGSLTALRIWLLRWRPRRLVEREPAFQGEHEWEFGADGVYVRGAHSEGRLGWPALREVWESPEGFLLFTQQAAFVYVPKRGFEHAEDVDRVRQLLREQTRYRQP